MIESAILGRNVGWTPHSPRAGFASESRALGFSFLEVREIGRWVADKSLRTYIDVVSAGSIAVNLQSQGLRPALAFAEEHWLEYFGFDILASQYAASR